MLRATKSVSGAKRGAQDIRWLGTAIACLAFCASSALAAPDQQSETLAPRLEQLEQVLGNGIGPERSVSSVITAAGLDDFARPAEYDSVGLDWAPQTTEPVEVQRLKMRLALTMLSQAYGAEDNTDVMLAQSGPELDALVIRRGNASLSDIRNILQDIRLQRASEGGPLVLKVPLIIWADASLQLHPGDELLLSRPDGAFIVNFGHLQVQDATIASVGQAGTTSPVFVPFVTTADGGTVQMQGGHIRGLGFGLTQKFSGFSIMRNSLRSALRQSWIDRSTFEDLKSVSVSAANDVILRGNHFRDMRGAALIVSRTRGARILSNLFSGKLPTNAIVLEEGSAAGEIAGNIVLGGQRTGIVVREGSKSARVANNIVWRRDGGGIAVSRSDCAKVSDNLVIENKHKGIEVRVSREADVRHNLLLDNQTAGIWVSAQPEGAQTYLSDNILQGNGSGVAGAEGANILLDGNDFTLQFPQFLSGDLAPQSASIARNLTGQEPILFEASFQSQTEASAPVCSE